MSEEPVPQPTPYPASAGGFAGPIQWRPTPVPPRRSRAMRATIGGFIALGLLGTGAGLGALATHAGTTAGLGTQAAADRNTDLGNLGSGSFGSGNQGSSGGFGSGTQGGSGTSGSGTSGSTTATSATTSQQVGVVDINTVLSYQSASAAGTGMILTSSGEVLTNNHVIDGATSISVTVISTGRTYTATVVGTDATADVAVIQLKNASALPTAKVSSTATVPIGAAVVGVGNAGGVGGTPSAAAGSVVALGQSITASDTDGSNPENLTGLIETNADIQAGDSGGPLYNAGGSIVGMDTAASTSNGYSATAQSYAIPIGTALAVATRIEAGQADGTIHIGDTAFLGVEIATTTGPGATVGGVLASGPAAKAGLVAGDVITSVGGQAVSSSAALSAVMATHHPGDVVALGWTDAAGTAHHANVTLATGPAQ